MTTTTSDEAKERFKEAMLKELAQETADRSQRHHRAGLVLGGLAIAILTAGLIGLPFSAFFFALAIWTMKDAYSADAELRSIQARIYLTVEPGNKAAA